MEDSEWLARHLRPLVGSGGEVELGPERDEAFGAWRRFFEELADERPLVLVFEDLHWADDGVLDFVDHLVDWATAVPILVVATARPELLERRPGWGGGKRNATTISLAPLTDEDTTTMVASLTSSLPPETQATLLRRAGGNPLYAEEFARMLADRGATEQVPETIQDVIAAWLDGLPAEEKALIQRAAVVGKVFWLGAVEAMDGASRRELEERLHALERKEFVRRERRSSVEGDTEFTFLHVLVRDVAYGQIPRGDRVDRHRRAAEWIASLGRSEDHSEMLAHHYLQALELAEAAGVDTEALIEPARRAFSGAGDRAAGLYAVETAERFYDAALRLWPEGDPARAQLLFRRAVPVGPHMGGGDPERLAEARDALLAAGDSAKAALAEQLISQSFWVQGLQQLSDESAERVSALLGDAPPSRSSAWILARQASKALVGYEIERAIAIGTQAQAVAEQIGWDEGVSDALSTLGAARVHVGDRGGLAEIERSIELSAKTGALGTLPRSYVSLAVANLVLGDFEAAHTARLEAARLGERLGSATQNTWFRGVLSDHHYRGGVWTEALRLAESVIAGLEAGSSTNIAGQVYIIRGEIRLARDDLAGSIADVEQAQLAARAIGGPQELGFVLSSAAYVLSRASNGGPAAAAAHEFLELLERGPSIGFNLINLPMFAVAAVRLGLQRELLDALAAQPELPWPEIARAYISGDFVRAAEMLRRIGSRPDEAEARLFAAEQFVDDGRRAEADEQLRQALEFYRSVGATRYLREGEGLLAESA